MSVQDVWKRAQQHAALERTQSRAAREPGRMARIIAAITMRCAAGNSATIDDVCDAVTHAVPGGPIDTDVVNLDDVLADLATCGIVTATRFNAPSVAYYIEPRDRYLVALLGARVWLDRAIVDAGKRIDTITQQETQ